MTSANVIAQMDPNKLPVKGPSWLGTLSLFLYRMFYFTAFAALLGVTAPVIIPVFGFLGYFIFYLLVFTVSICFHELGHLLGALIANLRISVVSVGILKIVLLGDKYRLRINRSPILSGSIYAAPVDNYNLDRRLILWTIGGPLMGLLYGFLCLLWYLLLLPPAGASSWLAHLAVSQPFQAWLLAGAEVSILISLHSILPWGDGSATSDGYKLIQYWRRGSEAQSLKYLYLLSGASQSGVRPRDWQKDWIEYLLQPSTPPHMRMQAMLLNYYAELDNGAIEQAGQKLDKALVFSSGGAFPGAGLYWEAAYFNARYRNQASVARQWLQRARSGFHDELQTQARAEAAILISEGKPFEALAWVAKGLSILDQSLEPGIAKAEREWLEDLQSLAAEFV